MMFHNIKHVKEKPFYENGGAQIKCSQIFSDKISTSSKFSPPILAGKKKVINEHKGKYVRRNFKDKELGREITLISEELI